MRAQELLAFLHAHRAWLSGLWAGAGGGASASAEARGAQAALLSQLLAALLKCCDPEVPCFEPERARRTLN
jgi:hypothetical protein